MKKHVTLVLLFLLAACASEKLVRLSDNVIPKTVHFTVTGRTKTNGEYATVTGAGVFVSPKGYILTCAHLFNHFKKVRLVLVTDSNENVYVGTIIKVSERVDLALVHCSFFDHVPFAKLADPRDLKIGQQVIAVGHPYGLNWSVTHGILSALYRDIGKNYNVTQSDTLLNPGNSGGPLFNLKGELVGINSFVLVSQANGSTGLGFSVQSGQCMEFLASVPKLRSQVKDNVQSLDNVAFTIRVLYAWVIGIVLVWLVGMLIYFRRS